MAFTGRLGTDDSQFGNLYLGSDGESAAPTSSFTADAVLQAAISASLTADAVISVTQAASFTADAVIALQGSASLTADAVVQSTVSASFTADAIISVAQAASFTADAEITVTGQATSFTADAVISVSQTGSFAADAVLRADQSSSFTADSFLSVINSSTVTADAVVQATISASFTADAVIPGAGSSFTADAVIVVTSRFYLSATLAAPISPSFESGWEQTTGALRRMMGRPSLAISTKTNLGIAETSTSGTFDVLIYQFVSEPIANAAVITGFTGLIRATEDNAAADFRSQSVLKVVSGDGTTLRGVVTDFNAGALSSEWPTTSSSQRFPFAASTSAGVSALAGDRIVVEVGYRAHNTSATSRTGTLRSGHALAAADFTTTGTTTDLNPWFDISATANLAPTEASFTANAVKIATVSSSLTADAIIEQIARSRHSRTGPQHTGVDADTDHLIAWAFDRYQRGQNLHEVLIDLDARLTAMESGFVVSHLQQFYANAVVQASPSQTFTASAHLQQPPMFFTADAYVLPHFNADAWLTNPAYYIDDNVLTAPTWAIDAVPRAAIINSSALTWDAVNDPDWFYGPGESYLTGWAKFTLASPANIHIDTVNGQGDMALQLWTGSPGAWPSEPYVWADSEIADPTNPWGAADVIDTLEEYGNYVGGTPGPLPAGTYYVIVHPWDQVPSPNFNLVLRIYLP